MDGTFGYGVTLSLVGLVITFLVLATISMVVSLIRRLDDRWQRREAANEARALERPPTIDETTAVLIAAAVSTWLVGRHRIRSIRRLLPADAPASPWSHQGRAVLQGSHVISKLTR